MRKICFAAFLTFSILLAAAHLACAEDRSVNEPKKYERHQYHPLNPPEDAAKKMVLNVEENRTLTSEGNITRVEGTDDFLGKGIEGLRADIQALEDKFEKLEEKFDNLESKIKRVKFPEPTSEKAIQ